MNLLRDFVFAILGKPPTEIISFTLFMVRTTTEDLRFRGDTTSSSSLGRSSIKDILAYMCLQFRRSVKWAIIIKTSLRKGASI